jgi:hypothetical protein
LRKVKKWRDVDAEQGINGESHGVNSSDVNLVRELIVGDMTSSTMLVGMLSALVVGDMTSSTMLVGMLDWISWSGIESTYGN